MFYLPIFFLLPLFCAAVVWAESAPAHKITLQLPWKHQFEFAGHYAAIEKGFYARRGLQVELREYQEGMDVVEEVLSGRADYGLYTSSVIRARLEGKPVVLLANYYKRLPLVILARPEIKNLADLRGKRLMISAKDLNSPLFKLAFSLEGLKAGENIEIVPHSFDAEPFLRGEVDAMSAYFSNEPFYLEEQAVPFNLIDLSGYMRSLGDVYLFTTATQAGQNPRQTQDVIEATNEGWEYALAHKEELADLILAQYSRRKSREALLYEARKTQDLILSLPLPVGSVFELLIHDVAELIMRQEGIADKGYLDDFLFDFQAAIRKIQLTPEERRWLATHTDIRLGTDRNWQPSVKEQENGAITGIEPDLLARVNALTGANIRLVLGEWTDIVAQAKRGELDGLAVSTVHSERAADFLFTASLYSSYKYLYTRQDKTASFRSMDDLAGKKVGLLQGNLAEEKLLRRWPGLIPVYKNSDIALATSLNNGELDATISGINLFLSAREALLPDLGIAFPVPDSELKLRYSIRKDRPELRSILDKSLAAIGPNEVREILEKWGAAHSLKPGDGLALNAEEKQWLKAHPTLLYCFSPLWKPYDYFENGQHHGMFRDYLDLFAQKLGVEFLPVPTMVPESSALGWQKALDFAKERHCDFISGAVRLPAREVYLNFSAPYFNITQVLIAKLDKPFVSSLAAILDKTIAVLPNSAIQSMLRRDFPDLKLLPVDTEHLDKTLENGEAYAFITTLENAESYLNGRLRTYKIIGKLDYPYPISVAMRNDWPELLGIMDKAVSSVTQAEHNEIRRKWNTITVREEVDYRRIWQVVIGALLILALLLYWNRRLAQAREELRLRHDELRHYFEQPLIGMQTFYPDKRTIHINRRFSEILGYTKEEMDVLRWSITHPDDLAAEEESLERIMRGETDNYQMEKRYFHKDGHIVHTHLAVACMRTDRGKMAYFIAMLLDISERKRAEEALRNSEQRLRAIIAAEPECIKILDRKGLLLQMNPAGLAMIEADNLEQVAGRLVLDLIAPEYREDYARLHRRVMAGESVQMTYEILGLKGRRRWLETHAVPLEDSGQRVHLAVTRDITERKRAEERLRQNEEKLRGLYELSPLGIALTDMQGHFLDFNDAFLKICGYPADELKTLDYWTLTPREYEAQETAQLEALSRTGRYGPYQKEYRQKDGRRIPLRLNGVLVTGQNGKPCIWSLVEDITAQKEYEAELQQARRQAEAANQAKSAFLANMSHELRTPLNAIIGFAQILEHDPTLHDKQRREVQSIRSGGNYLLTLINDVLDLAKIEAGRFEIFPEPWDTESFFKEISYMFRSRAEQKHIIFDGETTGVPRALYCDSKRLRQVVINLLGNAVKFTERGGVRLRAGFAEGKLRIAVTDTGVGIAQDEVDKIFEPFQQTGENHYKQQGTGLGLAISHRLIEAMGGVMRVESALGQGSTFYIEVPAETVESAPSLAESPSTEQARLITGYRRAKGDDPLRILIADDVADSRQIVRGLLEPLGFITAEAENGRQCLELAQSWQPDAILLDLRMPELDGLETSRCLRALPEFEHLPIIVISAAAFAEDREQSQIAGCNAHLAKPLRLEELLASLAQLLPLEWLSKDNGQKAEDREQMETLSEEHAASFLQLVKSGDIMGIEKFAEQLVQAGTYPVFAKKLLSLTQDFDIGEIVRLAEQRTDDRR